MVSKPANLLNLLATKPLHPHQPSLVELETHISQARDALHDAALMEASASGRFTGLYNAGHPFALAAFKILGYLSGEGAGHRQSLIASLEHAVPATEKDKPVFEKAHRDRNNAEYHGVPVIYSGSETEALVSAIKSLQEEVELMFRDWKKQQTSSRK